MIFINMLSREPNNQTLLDPQPDILYIIDENIRVFYIEALLVHAKGMFM